MAKHALVKVSLFSLLLLLNLVPGLANDDDLDPLVRKAEQQRIQVMRRAAASTISVFGLDGEGGGSGVIISPDGFALTNYHVSSACGDHMRCGLNDGRMYDAVIVGVDAVGDVSLIQLLGRNDFPVAPLGDSDQVTVGQWCFSAGNPFGLASNRQPSISLGIISGKNRYQYPANTILEYADCIQTDAAVNPGNSGGPLFDLAGEVIGINGRCSFEKRGRVNVGVGYAISANQIRMFLGLLKSGRLLDHATLGATVAADDSGRVVVSNILSSSDAYRRGLRYGDQVLRFAEREVKTVNAFKNILGTLPKDIRVPIEISRGQAKQTLLVRLSGVHSRQQLIDIVRAGLGGEEPKPPKRPGDKTPGDKKPSDGEPGERKPDGNDSETPSRELELEDRAQTDDEGSGKGAADASKEILPGQANVALVKSMLEDRPGFSNYFYNRLARQKWSRELTEAGQYGSSESIWRIKGKLVGESTPVELRLGRSSAQATIGSRTTQHAVNIADAITSKKQAGLVAAVQAMKDLMQQGPDKIGDTVYLGTFPVYKGGQIAPAGLTGTLVEASGRSSESWHQTFETAWYDARARFYWNETDRQLSLIELFGDEGVDPVEMYVSNYQTISQADQRFAFPMLLRVRYGSEDLLAVQVETVEISEATAGEPNVAAPSEAAVKTGPSNPSKSSDLSPEEPPK